MGNNKRKCPICGELREFKFSKCKPCRLNDRTYLRQCGICGDIYHATSRWSRRCDYCKEVGYAKKRKKTGKRY